MAAKKINKNMKFEEALAELEAAVEKLESGKKFRLHLVARKKKP